MVKDKIIELENRYGTLPDSVLASGRWYAYRYTNWYDRYYVDSELEASRRILHSLKTYSSTELKLSEENNDAAIVTASGTGLYWGLIPLGGNSKEHENKKVAAASRVLECLLSIGIKTVIIRTTAISKSELGTLMTSMYRNGWDNLEMIVEELPKTKCRVYFKFTHE